MMNKIRTGTTIIMTVIMVFLMVYANNQKGYAEEAMAEAAAQKALAEKYEKRMNEQEEKAIQLAAMARQAEREARQQVVLMEEALKKCRNK